MKVLTIKQPWATLIAEGLKEYEFRSWKTNYRGDILIHAGAGIDKKTLQERKIKYNDENLFNELFGTAYYLLGYVDKMKITDVD